MRNRGLLCLATALIAVGLTAVVSADIVRMAIDVDLEDGNATNSGVGTFHIRATVHGDGGVGTTPTSMGIGFFLIYLETTGDVMIGDVANDAPFLQETGFTQSRGSDPISGIAAAQSTAYAGGNDPLNDAKVLQGVGIEAGETLVKVGKYWFPLVWDANVLLASGTYSYTDGGTLKATHHMPDDFLLLPDNNGGEWIGPSEQIAVTGIIDATHTFGVTGENIAPTADADGPYIVYEGEMLNLDGSGSSDPDAQPAPLTYGWDLDGGGVYNDAVGAMPSVSPALLGAAADGGASYPIGLEVNDGEDTDTDTSTVVYYTSVKANASHQDEFGDDGIVEGDKNEGVTLNVGGGGGSMNYTYAWDLDHDGVFDNAVGPHVALTFEDIMTWMGITYDDIPEDGNVIFQPSARVTDTNGRTASQQLDIIVTPEPGTMALLGLGALGVLLRRRRRS